MPGMALEVSTQDVCHEVNLSRGGQFISNRARARYACRTDWRVLTNYGYVFSYWRNYHQRESGRRLLWKAKFADFAGFRRGIVGVREDDSSVQALVVNCSASYGNDLAPHVRTPRIPSRCVRRSRP